MAWIESHQSLLNHPKTRKLSRTLGIQRVYVIGHLHCLWWWCMEYADDGLLGRFDNDVIADACEWIGDPDEFVNALCEAGFLDRLGPGYAVHDWDDYAGKLIQKRRANTERMRVARAANNEPPSNKEEPRALHVQRTDVAHTHTCEATVPNLTVPNLTVPNQTEQEDDARARDSADDVAEILSQASWINDEPEAIAAAVRKSFAAIPDFNARDGPALALLFVAWKGYAKKPPANWYSAWVQWLRKEIRDGRQQPQLAGGSVPTNGSGATESDIARRGYSYNSAIPRTAGSIAGAHSGDGG